MELQEKSARAWKDKGWIDCGTNNDMFLAIAALANNTDLGQWLNQYLFIKHNKISRKDLPCTFLK